LEETPVAGFGRDSLALHPVLAVIEPGDRHTDRSAGEPYGSLDRKYQIYCTTVRAFVLLANDHCRPAVF
jgi:hypothetical protein